MRTLAHLVAASRPAVARFFGLADSRPQSRATPAVPEPQTDSRTHTFILGDHSILFECPSKISLQRAQWILIKEPGTIAWINAFAPGSVFWDIGANIGVFSLYAAVVRDCRVLAFEPTAPNYYGLNRNVVLNKLNERVHAYCVAIDRKCGLDDMQMRDDTIGTALHTFGKPIDYKGDTFNPAWRQGAVALSIDALVSQFGAPFPAHIKIDVDGLETAVIEGGRQTFSDPRFQSVLVEVNLDDEHEVAAVSNVLEAAGLRRDDEIPGNHERDVNGARIYNLVFSRPKAGKYGSATK